jgi:hypothetical protein
MSEHDLGQNVAELNENVAKINRRLGGSAMAMWRGILAGFGYIIGASIAILLIGWVLNVIGIIPSLKAQVDSLKQVVQEAQQRQVPIEK